LKDLHGLNVKDKHEVKAQTRLSKASSELGLHYFHWRIHM